MNYRLSAHAREELDRRQIPPALLKNVLSDPKRKWKATKEFFAAYRVSL
ncbi:hypothetical protein BH20VER2_BH20VER2_00960 [soil metagenome]